MTQVSEDLSQVLALLVDSPREVAVHEVESASGPRLEVQVAEGDLGKIIGRQGRTARALRRVLAARAAHGEPVRELKILDD